MDIFEAHAEICKLFSNPVRLRIVWELGKGEMTVSEIAKALNLPVTNISQHLRLMKDKGAVIATRQGKHVVYRLASPLFLEGCRKIRQGLIEVGIAKGKDLAAASNAT